MERRKLLALAGATLLTASTAVVTVGASFGLFGLTSQTTRVGRLSSIQTPTSTVPPRVETIYVDPPSAPTPPEPRAEPRNETPPTSPPRTIATPPVAPSSDAPPSTPAPTPTSHEDHGHDAPEPADD